MLTTSLVTSTKYGVLKKNLPEVLLTQKLGEIQQAATAQLKKTSISTDTETNVIKQAKSQNYSRVSTFNKVSLFYSHKESLSLTATNETKLEALADTQRTAILNIFQLFPNTQALKKHLGNQYKTPVIRALNYYKISSLLE